MNTSHYLTLPAKNYEKIIEDQVIEAEASSPNPAAETTYLFPQPKRLVIGQ